MNIRLFAAAVLLWSACPAFGQVVPGFECFANVAVPPTLRQEGLTELVGDIVVNCNYGGPQTPAGQPYSQANVTVFLNTNITSRIIGPGNLTEATLLIDDPAFANQYRAPVISVPIISTGGNYAPAPSRPNVYQGLLQNPNQIVFLGVPILAPVSAGFARVFRITNVRANASQMGFNQEIKSIISINPSVGTGQYPINNPAQTLGFVRSGLIASVFSKGSGNSGTGTLGRAAELRFSEGFAAAFKTRVSATSPTNPNAQPTGQDIPGSNPNTESGLVVAGGGGVGLTDSGTRLMARFINVPAGTRIFVSGQNLASDGPQVARAVTSPNGPIQLQVLQTNLFYEIFRGTDGFYTAFFEILKANAAAIETFSVPVDISYPASPLATTSVTSVLSTFAPNPTLLEYLNSQSSFSSNFGFGSFTDGTQVRIPFNYLNVAPVPFVELRTTNASQTNMFATPSECVIKDDLGPARDYASIACNIAIGAGLVRANGLGISSETVAQSEVPAPQSISETAKSGPAAAPNWLTATLDQFSTPALLSITASPTGLAPGTYNGRVTVTSTTAGAGPVSIPVTYTVRPSNVPKVISFGVTNAGSYANNVVAPGEAVVIFGRDFGPAAIETLKLTNNVVDTVLGGTRVLFDGVPSPMIYAVTGQVSCFVPFTVAGKKFVQMEVEQNGVKSEPVTIAVAEAVPGMLTADLSGGGQGAILNQDYTPNGQNGALPGEYVFIFGTGAGQTSPPALDGRLNPGTSVLTIQPIKVFLDDKELPASAVQYAGPAPNLVEGVFQVNIKLPADVRRGAIPLVIKFGAYSTQPGVTVNVR